MKSFLAETYNDEGNTFLKCVDPKGLGDQGLNWRGGRRVGGGVWNDSVN